MSNIDLLKSGFASLTVNARVKLMRNKSSEQNCERDHQFTAVKDFDFDFEQSARSKAIFWKMRRIKKRNIKSKKL